MRTIGIDPGLLGAIACLDSEELKLFKMPTFEIETKLAKPKKLKSGLKTHKKESFIDTKELRRILLDECSLIKSNSTVFVEDIGAFFGMAAGTNFKMGYSLGMIHGVLDMYTSQYHLIKPSVWQKKIWIESDKVKRVKIKESIKQSRTDTKQTSINCAKRIFPDETFIPKGKRVPDDGMVDAALMAHVGQLILKDSL